MSLTQVDATPALLVIDLQKGITGLATVHPAADVIARAAELASSFRKHGFPVVLVNVSGRAPGRTDAGTPKFTFLPDWTELVPELEQQSSDYVVTKQRPGAFIGTSLQEILQLRGVTQVFLAGIATSAGVEATARSAYDLGYHVVLVIDAMTDRDGDMHRHCLEKIFPRIGESATAEAVVRALELLQ